MAKKKVVAPPLRLSWSAISAFLTCQRKFELTYGDNLEKIPGADNRNLILGSAVHAGIEAALLASYNSNNRAVDYVAAGVRGVADYMKLATVQNKTTWSYETRTWITDYEYYAMVAEVGQLASELVRFHIPMIGIGIAVLVPSVDDVLHNVPPGTHKHSGMNQPAIEWHFEYDLGENTVLTGIVDTVLWHIDTQQYILTDWKTRSAFPQDSLALLDGQAHLYAAVINAMADHYNGVKPISHVAMWQMKTKTPAPASISTKTFLPNTGAASYDTTWEHWCATLPDGIDPARYEAIMRPKMKLPEDFQRVASGVVTDVSSALAVENVQLAAQSIRAALATGQALPAILSSNGCKFCDFQELCSTTLRYGGDASELLARRYQKRTGRIETQEAVE